jgi:glucose-6-phosphate isomerase
MDPTRHAALARLSALAARPNGRRITPLYEADPARAARFSAELDDLTLDYSQSSIDNAARDALFGLAEAADLDGFRRRLFAGAHDGSTAALIARFRALRGEA